jgi:hypothetical protein
MLALCSCDLEALAIIHSRSLYAASISLCTFTNDYEHHSTPRTSRNPTEIHHGAHEP